MLGVMGMVDISNYFWVLLISMIPVIELRGAIPVAIGLDIHPIAAYVICVAGNMLPVPFILLFIKPVFKVMKKIPKINKIIYYLESKAMNKSSKVERFSFWGLAIFVGIPLPGTGAWTGALIASLLNMRLKHAILCTFIGVLAAGVVVTLISTGAFAGITFLRGIFTKANI